MQHPLDAVFHHFSSSHGNQEASEFCACEQSSTQEAEDCLDELSLPILCAIPGAKSWASKTDADALFKRMFSSKTSKHHSYQLSSGIPPHSDVNSCFAKRCNINYSEMALTSPPPPPQFPHPPSLGNSPFPAPFQPASLTQSLITRRCNINHSEMASLPPSNQPV